MSAISRLKEKFIGPKDFYKKFIIMALPLMFEQILESAYSIIDTIMVSGISRGIAGVGIGSQIISIFQTIAFGICSGFGIFLAQFYGRKDETNMKKTFAFGFLVTLILMSIFSIITFFLSTPIISLFTQDQEVILVADEYLKIAIWSIIPSCCAFAFMSSYRNVQKTLMPFLVCAISCGTNTLLNYILINGALGAPALGVKGAAIASVVATSFELILFIALSYIRKIEFAPNIKSFKDSFNPKFFTPIVRKSLPLVLNETLFSVGYALYAVFINRMGSDSYEAFRIAENVVTIMYSATFALSACVQSMIGEQLGRKEYDKAMTYSNYFMALGFVIAVVLGVLILILAPYVVYLYSGQSAQIYADAANVLRVYSFRIILRTFSVILFALFRAGGDSKFVAILDSVVLWTFGIVTGAILTYAIQIQDVAIFFLIVQIEGVARVIIGMIHYARRKWVKNVTDLVKDNVEKIN